jgi:hypothetical protein
MMEAIKSISTSLPEGIAPTYQALLPHLLANADNIKTQYSRRLTNNGSDPRHELDVYYPNETLNSPIFLFCMAGVLSWETNDKLNILI